MIKDLWRYGFAHVISTPCKSPTQSVGYELIPSPFFKGVVGGSVEMGADPTHPPGGAEGARPDHCKNSDHGRGGDYGEYSPPLGGFNSRLWNRKLGLHVQNTSRGYSGCSVKIKAPF